ncbi:hypothetical protein AZE42_12124, partial [Rhizopogon vesiculosus]
MEIELNRLNVNKIHELVDFEKLDVLKRLLGFTHPDRSLSRNPRSIVGVTNRSAHDLYYPCDTLEDEHRSRMLMTRTLDLFALSPNAGAHNDILCNDKLDNRIPATLGAANRIRLE